MFLSGANKSLSAVPRRVVMVMMMTVCFMAQSQRREIAVKETVLDSIPVRKYGRRNVIKAKTSNVLLSEKNGVRRQ